MRLKLVYSDFDGTLTALNGAASTSSVFYKTLFNDDKKIKDSDELQALFTEYFKDPSDPMLITPDAVAYLKAALSSPDVRIHIVTRNLAPYIQALLKFQGFTDEQIASLIIMDSKNEPPVSAGVYQSLKYNHVVQQVVQYAADQVVSVHVFDDDIVDGREMAKAIKDTLRMDPTLISQRSGEFKWEIYQMALHSDEPILQSQPITPLPASEATFFKSTSESRLARRRKSSLGEPPVVAASAAATSSVLEATGEDVFAESSKP